MPGSRPSAIYILVGDVAYNRGDLGSIYSQIEEIEKIYPGAHITFCTLDPERHRKWFRATILQRSFFINRQQIMALRQADLVVWGGGAFMTDHGCRALIPYWLMMIFIVRFLLRKKIVAVSHGVVLETMPGKWLSRLAYRWVDAVACRDEGSAHAAQALGGGTPVVLSGDYATLLQPDACLSGENVQLLGPKPENTIAICVTFWHLYNSRRAVLPYIVRRRLGLYRCMQEERLRAMKEGLARLADRLLEKQGGRICFIPRYTSPDWDDILHLREVRGMCADPQRVGILEEESIHPAQYPLMLAAHRFVISIPLHDCIFTAVAGKPFVALPYESKCEYFVKALDAKKYCVRWEALFSKEGVEGICRVVEAAMDEWPRIAPVRAQAMDILRDRARVNGEVMRAVFEEGAWKGPEFSGAQESMP